MTDSNGIYPLTYQEIYAFMKATKTPLNEDEVILLKNMSQSYVTHIKITDPSYKMPYTSTKKGE